MCRKWSCLRAQFFVILLGSFKFDLICRLLMASAIPTTSITDEERKWVVIGLCLAKVLAPALRNIIATEIPKWYHDLCQPPTKIDQQLTTCCLTHLSPSTLNLNYVNINSNKGRARSSFDYSVKDPLSLAKLFVKPSMCEFIGFDQTMDLSAILAVICEAAPFTAAAPHAKKVRSGIRNEWAHCNFANWTEGKYADAFLCMETLLKNVNLSPEEEQQMCEELNSWNDKGKEEVWYLPPIYRHLSTANNEMFWSRYKG